MKRASSVRTLKENYLKSKKRKEEINSYIKSLEKKVKSKEITYKEFLKYYYKKTDGKTPEEWKKTYVQLEKSYKKKFLISKTALFLGILTILLTLIFIFQPKLTGFATQETDSEYIQLVNENFNETQVYIFKPKEIGNLTSILISGEIIPSGRIKITIDNVTILDTENINEKFIETKKIASPLTGKIIAEETNENSSQEKNISFEENDLIKNLDPEVQNTTQEEIIQEKNQSTQNITQEEIINQTEPTNESYFLKEEEVETSPKKTPPLQKEKIKIKNYCEESCLFNLEEKDGYEIKIEIENSSIFLKEITYRIKNPTPTNETNITKIKEEEIKTELEQIRVGEPVKWKKTISSEEDLLKIDLPKEAKNIEIKKIEKVGNERIETDLENFSINGKLETQIKERFSITGKIIQTEEENSVEVIIENEADEYEIIYETPPVEKNEKIISKKEKEITIFSEAELNYTNILASTTLETETYESEIKLYHLIENKKIEIEAIKLDKNNNGKIDSIEWIVPHLSNQTYYLELKILNLQSYPEINGNWTVFFQTAGKNDLIISGEDTIINGNNNSDLEFIQILCGDEKISTEKENNSYKIQNYECEEVSSETSKVLTQGKHTLKFSFGNITEFANNYATYSKKTCSEEWGFDCGVGPPEGGDNTWDSCEYGTGADESVEEIFISSNIVKINTELEITCSFDPYTSNDDIFIWYYNGSSWKKILEEKNIGSSSIINRSVSLIPDAFIGTHWVRCGIIYGTNSDLDECMNTGSWYDNDDVSFNVTLENSLPSQESPILNSTFNTNTTQENLTCNIINQIDADNEPIKSIINWNKNNQSIAILNIPMEAKTTNEEVKDYAQNKTLSAENVIWGKNYGHDLFGAYYFQGNSKINTNLNLSEILGESATLSFFIKTNQSGNDIYWLAPGITGIEQSGGGNDIFWGWIDSSGHISITAGNGDSAKSTSIINNNSWYHVALTRNSTSGLVQVFINGNLENEIVSEAGTKTTSFSSIGLIEDTAGTNEYFIGYLDDLLLFDTVLSKEQIKIISEGNNQIISEKETKLNDLFSCESTITDLTDNSETKKSNSLLIKENFAPTIPTQITCDGESCNRSFQEKVNIQCSGSTDADSNEIFYEIFTNTINSTNKEFPGKIDKILVGYPNYSTKTCSEEWGFDCGVGPPEAGDNTWDSCENGAGADESVENIYLNSTKVEQGEAINITCEFDPYTSGDDSFIWYHNGTSWKKIYERINWGSSTKTNVSISLIPDNFIGKHWIRCGITYSTDTSDDNCANGGTSYFDNDDVSFEVIKTENSIEENTSEKTFYQINSNLQKLDRIKIIFTVESYNPEASILNNNQKPDLKLNLWTGTNWGSDINLNLSEYYPESTYQKNQKQIQIQITNPDITQAWKNSNNQNILINGVYFDSTQELSDEINYSNIKIIFEEININYLGNHTEDGFVELNFSNQQIVDELICRATDYLPPKIYSENLTVETSITKEEPSPPSQNIIVYNNLMTDVSVGLNEGPLITPISIKFQVYHPVRYTRLNDQTAMIEFSKPEEETRSSQCSRISSESSGKYANYSCLVNMNFWDGPGIWKIKANITDIYLTTYEDSSKSFQVGSTSGFIISNQTIFWGELSPGEKNKLSINPISLKNTGNTKKQISIFSTNLIGEIDSSRKIYANNFSISPIENCNGTQMQDTLFKTIQNASLNKGNYLLENGTGEQNLYFCIKEIPENIISQNYKTQENNPWIIRIFALLISRRKKKIKIQKIHLLIETIKEKNIEEKDFLELINKESRKKFEKTKNIPISIFNSKIGALEAITKYLKENIDLTYSEIAFLLNRDERTIWTAYKKSIEKMKEKIAVKNKNDIIPIEKLNKKEFTILESVIKYLREKNLKYVEIGKILNRNERNIWTINRRIEQTETYSRQN